MAPNKNVETVKYLLANATNKEAVESACTPNVTYVSLCYDNPPLKQLMPYAGRHDEEGPSAILFTFTTVNKIWQNEDFQIEAIFGEGEHVAVFGHFTYRSNPLGKAYQSPFNVWCRLNGDGKVYYMQFMEDTFGTARTFEDESTGIKKKYKVVEEGFDL
jgi:hypothetical protein